MGIKDQVKQVVDSNYSLAKTIYPIIRRRQNKQIEAGIKKPVLMGIELTNECPFSCVMCVRTEGMKRATGHMSEELFKKIIDDYVGFNPDAARNSELTMTHFGESLSNPIFSQLIRYAVDSGCGNTLLSINPLLLTKPVQKKLLESKIHKIHFSLDGHDDASFEKIRGVKNAYGRSKENLLEFIALVRSENAPIYLRLGMVDFGLNKDSISKMREYWGTVGLDEVWVKPAEAWSGLVESVNTHVKFIPRTSRRIVPTCGQPFNGTTITFNGKAVACCSDHDDILVLGDLNTQTLQEVFVGEPYRRLRGEFLSGKVQNRLCKSCKFLGIHFD